jgi:hypothetical protein
VSRRVRRQSSTVGHSAPYSRGETSPSRIFTARIPKPAIQMAPLLWPRPGERAKKHETPGNSRQATAWGLRMEIQPRPTGRVEARAGKLAERVAAARPQLSEGGRARPPLNRSGPLIRKAELRGVHAMNVRLRNDPTPPKGFVVDRSSILSTPLRAREAAAVAITSRPSRLDSKPEDPC